MLLLGHLQCGDVNLGGLNDRMSNHLKRKKNVLPPTKRGEHEARDLAEASATLLPHSTAASLSPSAALRLPLPRSRVRFGVGAGELRRSLATSLRGSLTASLRRMPPSFVTPSRNLPPPRPA
jgi:hypothetical protein